MKFTAMMMSGQLIPVNHLITSVTTMVGKNHVCMTVNKY